MGSVLKSDLIGYYDSESIKKVKVIIYNLLDMRERVNLVGSLTTLMR